MNALCMLPADAAAARVGKNWFLSYKPHAFIRQFDTPTPDFSEQHFSAANVRELQFNFRILLHPPQGAGHVSVCDFYTCPFCPGRRQRFMGERTKTFIENTFSILPLGDSRTSNCKFNKALYNMAKTLSPALTHTRCRCFGCECNNLQHFNRIRRRRWELGAGRLKAEDGQRPRSKCILSAAWRDFGTWQYRQQRKDKKKWHIQWPRNRTWTCASKSAPAPLLTPGRNEKPFKSQPWQDNCRPGRSVNGKMSPPGSNMQILCMTDIPSTIT